MSSGFTKHVNETDEYSVNFDSQLSSGETLTSPAISVLLKDTDDGTYEDVTSEFGTPSPSINDTLVEFTLEKATTPSSEQLEEYYLVECKVETSNGRTLFDFTSLSLSRQGV